MGFWVHQVHKGLKSITLMLMKRWAFTGHKIAALVGMLTMGLTVVLMPTSSALAANGSQPTNANGQPGASTLVQAKQDGLDFCKGPYPNNSNLQDKCAQGYVTGISNANNTKKDACDRYSGAEATACGKGYDEGHSNNDQVQSQIAEAANACAEKYPNGSSLSGSSATSGSSTGFGSLPPGATNSNDAIKYIACVAAYRAAAADPNKSKDDICGSISNTTQKAGCEAGVTAFKATQDSGGGDSDSNADPCSKSNTSGPLAWILCPIIKVSNAAITTIGSKPVLAALYINPLKANSGSGLYQLWRVTRDLANAIFVVVFIVIIFSNALSIEQYNVKKILPRLVAAAILVQFSFAFCSIIIDIGNVLGSGIGQLTQSITNSLNSGSSSAADGSVFGYIGGWVFDIFGAALLVAVAIPTLVIFAVGALLGILAVFITVVVRQLVLQVLVIMAPLAFVAWVLPGTENYFKTWYKLITRLVLMYPMIVLILSISGILALTASTDTADGSINKLIAAAFPTIGFFLIPMTFKWAGGAMAFAAGYITGAANKGNKAIKGSQVAKNAQSNYSQKAATLGVTGRNPVTRRVGSLGAGGFGLMGNRANNRMVKLMNEAIDSKSKTVGQRLSSAGNDTLLALAMGNKNEHTTGYKNDTATQVLAIRELAKRKQYDQLRGPVRTQIAASRGAEGGAAIWRTAASGFEGDVRKEAPDVSGFAGGFDSLHTLTPERVSDLHESTIGAVAGSGDSRARQSVLDALVAVQADPQLMAKMSTAKRAALRQHAASFSTEHVIVPGHGTMSGTDFINHHF